MYPFDIWNDRPSQPYHLIPSGLKLLGQVPEIGFCSTPFGMNCAEAYFHMNNPIRYTKPNKAIPTTTRKPIKANNIHITNAIIQSLSASESISSFVLFLLEELQ
jgi:hypothetical protein